MKVEYKKYCVLAIMTKTEKSKDSSLNATSQINGHYIVSIVRNYISVYNLYTYGILNYLWFD